MSNPVAVLVSRFFEEVLNGQNRASADELLAVDFVVNHPVLPGVRGVDGVLGMVGALHAAFSDLHYTVVEVIVDEERAAVRWVATGTHDGQLFSLAPTHRSITVVGTDVFHASHRRLTETWVNSDFFGMFVQLGVIPPLPVHAAA